MSATYVPQDGMSLWWLTHPAAPQLIGALSLQDNRRKVALIYDPGWMASPQGFPLSEDLPLRTGLMLPAERDTVVGAVNDARPDQWGERVIRLIERPARLSLLEYLYFAGDDRFGALGVSLQANAYVPATKLPCPRSMGCPTCTRRCNASWPERLSMNSSAACCNPAYRWAAHGPSR